MKNRGRRVRRAGRATVVGGVAGAMALMGCFDSALLLNPSFVNTVEGGLFPFVPGAANEMILIRSVNTTNQSLLFVVTIERARLLAEGSGSVNESETIEVFTGPGDLANEAGVLFDCTGDNPINRIGLGENLNRPDTEPGLFVGGVGDITQGFGVPPNINPLSRENGDFACGDTVIFEAFISANAPGGFKVRAFVLPHEGQPERTRRDTFTVAAEFLRDRPSEE